MDISLYGKKANDWKITSFGDVGGFAGYGAKLTHVRFYSQTVGKKIDSALLQVGLGVGGEVKLDLGKMFYSIMDALSRANTAVKADKNYTALTCHVPFSIDDIDQARCSNIDTGLSIPFGYKSGFCHASSASGQLLFSVPATVDPVFTLMVKAEASASAGVFMVFNNRQSAQMAEFRKQHELNRRPSEPPLRPMGGYQ